jgi:hypothetical protein
MLGDETKANCRVVPFLARPTRRETPDVLSVLVRCKVASEDSKQLNVWSDWSAESLSSFLCWCIRRGHNAIVQLGHFVSTVSFSLIGTYTHEGFVALCIFLFDSLACFGGLGLTAK